MAFIQTIIFDYVGTYFVNRSVNEVRSTFELTCGVKKTK